MSYTWGAPNLDQQLRVLLVPWQLGSPVPLGDGNDRLVEILHITKELKTALLRCRNSLKARLLWVDQICINQNDIAERSSQVLLMKKIYQGAQNTVVWIGEPKDDGDVPLIGELINALEKHTLSEQERAQAASEIHKKYPNAGPLPSIPSARLSLAQQLRDGELFDTWIDVKTQDQSTVGSRRRQAVKNLFNKKWFNRAWVVQEALVSPRVEIIYGPVRTSLEMVTRLGKLVHQTEMSALGWRHALHITTTGFMAFMTINHYKHHFDHAGCLNESFLVFMTNMQGDSAATDPRDKVYAFLGLKAAGRAPNVVPDYRKSTAEVYTDTAISFIEESKSLDLLALVEGNEVWTCKCNSMIPDLPSWAPNWSQKFHGLQTMIGVGLICSFRSARDLPHHQVDSTSLDMPRSSLHVKGKCVATIRKVLSKNFDRERSFYDGIRVALPLNEIAEELGGKEFGDDLKTSIFRTLLADGSFGDTPPLKYPIDKLINAHTHQEEFRKLDRASEDYKTLLYLQNCSMMVQRKRFFRAEGIGNMALGLGNLFIRSGDLVCVFYGSRVPVIIREHGSNSDPTKRCYKVICQCYLDGWMFGDFPAAGWWDEFEQSPDGFTLV